MRNTLLIALAAVAVLSCHRREAPPPAPAAETAQGGFANMDAIPTPRRTHKEEIDRTMTDMRAIATAWEARATDVNTYKVGDVDGPVSFDELAGALTPTYMAVLPRNDAWHNALGFSTSNNGQTYEIRSGGGPGSSEIVFSNGTFTSAPTVPNAR